MGSKQQELIIMFPRQTFETTIFDPVEREIRELYTYGLHLPTPVRPTERRGFTRDEFLSLHTAIINNLYSPQPLPEISFDEDDDPSVVNDYF
jgi:hypothetical protein